MRYLRSKDLVLNHEHGRVKSVKIFQRTAALLALEVPRAACCEDYRPHRQCAQAEKYSMPAGIVISP
jgi:hypothetical protein